MNDFDASILRGYDQAIAHARDMTHDMTLEEDARRYWLAEHRALSGLRLSGRTSGASSCPCNRPPPSAKSAAPSPPCSTTAPYSPDRRTNP